MFLNNNYVLGKYNYRLNTQGGINMQLRRATEICNNNENNNITLYYNAKPVKLVSVDNNIGTAYIQSLNDTSIF